MKVLIVEDDRVLSLLHRKFVERIGFTVLDTIISGQEAMEKTLLLNPDLILMDVMLDDDVDGIDVVAHLRKQNINTPVIFITGNSDSYNRKRAESTNFTDYLIKPISYEILMDSISKISDQD